MDDKQKEKDLLGKEKAELRQKLLSAAANKPAQQAGRVVNDFGQEEAGVPKWQQKAAALRDMYASCATSADVGHEQRILQQLQAKKLAKAHAAQEASRGGGSAGRLGAAPAAATGGGHADPGLAGPAGTKRDRGHPDSSDSDSDRERKKSKKKKDKKKKRKKDKKKKKERRKSSSSSSDSSSDSDSGGDRKKRKKDKKS